MDEITIKPKPETVGTNLIQEPQGRSNPNYFALICAIGLGTSFFLPWADIMGFVLSGFDLQKSGNGELFLWSIPVFSLIVLVGALSKRSLQGAGPLTGILPYIVGAYWYAKMGNDFFHVLSYGAYLSLLFGAGLIVVSFRRK